MQSISATHPLPTYKKIVSSRGRPAPSGTPWQRPNDVAFSPAGETLAFLEDGCLFTRKGKHARLLANPKKLLKEPEELTPEELALRERMRISGSGIVAFDWDSAGRQIAFSLGGKPFLADVKSRKTQEISGIEGGCFDVRISPQGRYLSYVRERNLYIYDTTQNREIALTDGTDLAHTSGTAEFVAQEEMDRTRGYWWSRDDARMAYAHVDNSPIEPFKRMEVDANGIRVVEDRYPFAGKPNAKVELVVTNFNTKTHIKLPSDAEYVARVDWLPDSRRLAVQVQTRDQKSLRLLIVDSETGNTETLLEEKSPTYVNLHNNLKFLEKQNAFLWTSERSGFRHIYLYGLDGSEPKQLTDGEWPVSCVVGVNENLGKVYFESRKETPLERHLYSVSLDSNMETHPQKMTNEEGVHTIVMSDNGETYLDRYEGINCPSKESLVSTAGKSRPKILEDLTQKTDAVARVRFGQIEGSSGDTLHYRMVVPADFNINKRYPAIVDVYGGPSVQKVQKGYMGNVPGYLGYLAKDHVIFSLDNRGTPGRGKAFESATYGRLGECEVIDQCSGTTFLRQLPFVDESRVGVIGWSYGGYMSLMLALRAPELFSCAVAINPVTKWEWYDTHYTEHYNGLPDLNPDGYKNGSVFTYADSLEIPLMMMLGQADDNVFYAQSLELLSHFAANQQLVDQQHYPGQKHGLNDFYPHVVTALTDFFHRRLT